MIIATLSLALAPVPLLLFLDRAARPTRRPYGLTLGYLHIVVGALSWILQALIRALLSRR